jgi:hypothetical protein
MAEFRGPELLLSDFREPFMSALQKFSFTDRSSLFQGYNGKLTNIPIPA